MNNYDNLKEELASMLGKHTFDNHFQVNPDFGRLCKAINYLASQITMSGTVTDYKDRNDYIEEILENTVEILKK